MTMRTRPRRRNRGAWGWAAVLWIMAASCAPGTPGETMDKDFNRVRSYPAFPAEYRYTDFAQKARDYDRLVFDPSRKGLYLPLIWDDRTHRTFGIPAYVGDGRMNQDGAQEAVATMAAVLSATLSGIDKSRQNGRDYVEMLNAYFSPVEGVVLNNPRGTSATTSLWYLLYPAILYTQISDHYPGQAVMAQNVLRNLESWYGAYLVMEGRGQPDFDYTGFNFVTKTPYRNGVWREPDGAVGLAVLFYRGYQLTGDPKYLTAVFALMDYSERFFGSPLYEVLQYYAPALAARLNALHGTRYDVTKALNRVFDGTSLPRGGWGSLAGRWGDYEVNGLFGSTSDGGGYAFSMNTFAAAGAIAPLARYDSRYARSLGRWLVHLTSNARYFFSEHLPPASQSLSVITGAEELAPEILRSVPYEGLRKESRGRSPWLGGDPTVYGWAKTDFSLYSGAHTGILGALVEATGQPGVLKVDLLATAIGREEGFPTFLLYNPHPETRQVPYRTKEPGRAADLYDTLTNKVVASSVTEAVLTLAPDQAAVLVELPPGTKLESRGPSRYAGGTYVSTDAVSVVIRGLKNNDSVSGVFELRIGLVGNAPDSLHEATVSIDKTVVAIPGDRVMIDTAAFEKGGKKVTVRVVTEQGVHDEATIRLKFE